MKAGRKKLPAADKQGQHEIAEHTRRWHPGKERLHGHICAKSAEKSYPQSTKLRAASRAFMQRIQYSARIQDKNYHLSVYYIIVLRVLKEIF